MVPLAQTPSTRTGPPPVLVTGFDAFGGAQANPSADLLPVLQGGRVAGHPVATLLLPTEFARAPEVLAAWLQRHGPPALVLALGQAGGRAALSLERVAINLVDARIPDNAGAQPIDAPVLAGAPPAYFSTLPVKAMCHAVAAVGVPAELSFSAGSFVCNQVFFHLMHQVATSAPLQGVRAGFMHLPWLPAQGSPSLPLDAMARGVRAALDCALRTGADLATTGGRLD